MHLSLCSLRGIPGAKHAGYLQRQVAGRQPSHAYTTAYANELGPAVAISASRRPQISPPAYSATSARQLIPCSTAFRHNFERRLNLQPIPSSSHITLHIKFKMSLSARSVPYGKHTLPYFDHVMQALGTPWTLAPPAHTGPTCPTTLAAGTGFGYVNMAVAENMNIEAKTQLSERIAEVAADLPQTLRHLAYDNMSGIEPLRSAWAGMLKNTLLHGTEIDKHQLLFQSGVGSLLDTLGHCLGDPGDSVLIPTPYYPGFDSDFGKRAGLRTVPVRTDAAGAGATIESSLCPTEAQLEQAVAACTAAGSKPCMLVLTHPHNPTGYLYSAEELRALATWGAEHKIHVVCDEIYANSLWGDVSFVSMVNALNNDLGDWVHVLWGASKDWAASGMRVGCLYTQNERLQAVAGSLCMFGAISGLTQQLLGAAIADSKWSIGFLELTSELLHRQASALTKSLVTHCPWVRVRSTGATLFLWLDMRAAVTAMGGGWEAEQALYKKLFEEQCVLLVPGQYCHMDEPGWYRACFSSVQVPALELVGRRIQAAVAGLSLQ